MYLVNDGTPPPPTPLQHISPLSQIGYQLKNRYSIIRCIFYYLRFKLFTLLRSFRSFSDNLKEIIGENKRNAFSIDSKLLLKVTQKVAEIDMKYLSVFCNHYIAIMSIADSEYESGHTIAGTRFGEVVLPLSRNCLYCVL